MSINRNFTRTLSGANSFTIDNLELSSHKNTIRINGNSGNAGDVLGKDENNRLVFQTLAPFVIDPDSIDGTKLTNNISITTTGNYTGNSITLTGNLQVDNNVNIDGNLTYAGDLNIDDLIVDSLTLDPDFVGDGNINLNQHQIVGDYVNLNINGNTGSIVCFQLTTKNSVLIEDTLNVTGLITGGAGLTLTGGNITLNTGSINLTAGNVIASAGDMECVDFEATGEITGGDNITIIGNYSSTNGNITLTNGNISVVDVNATNGFFDDITLPKTGTAVITLNGTNGNINTDGNFTTTGGNIHTSSGNIFTSTGDIHANGGYVRGDELRFLTKLQLGNSANPSIYLDDTELNVGTNIITTSHTGSYLSNDFALELTEANSHALIGGNLKVNGTIYGSIIGDVSETHVNCQSLRVHDLGDEGGNTGLQVEDGYDIRMYSDAGTTKTIDLDSSNGNITIAGTLFGNVEGEISEDHINGQSLTIENLGVAGDTGIEVHDGFDFSIYSDGGITKTFGITGSTGDYNSKDGDITLTNGDITLTTGDISSVNLTTTGNITLTGDLTSTDGNITLTNGDITLTGGVLYGDVVGNIVEEHIDAQSLTIRDNGTGTGDTGIIIEDGYDIDFFNNSSQKILELSGNTTGSTTIGIFDAGTTNLNFQVTPTGSINRVNNILHYGTALNMVNSGTIIMNDGVITDITGGGNSQQFILDFDNKNITMRNTNTIRIVINTTDITLNDDTQTQSIKLSSLTGNIDTTGDITLTNGDIIIDSNSGEIIGKNSSSTSTNDDNTTNMKNIRIDESCFKYDTREISMSKPNSRVQRQFTTTSTAWTELNDALYVKLITNNKFLNDFIVEWSYYAVKDDGSRLWAKLFDIDAKSPADVDQPSYLNNTKQVLFDGGADKPQQHHATFTIRSVTANVNKNIGVCVWTILNTGSYIYFYMGPNTFNSDPPTGGTISSYAFGGMTLQIKKLYDNSVSNATPTGWVTATASDLMQVSIPEKLMSYSYIDSDTQNFVRIYNTSNKYIFDGNQDTGTDTLEVHFTATSTHGYLEFGFYANTLTAGMVFHVGVAVATGGTSPFSTTLTSSAVSIDGYKLGLFNGDTSRYSLKEILDFTSYENTYLTSKFHFNNLTIGTEYKMALYGRCNFSGSIYINAGGKSTTGTANRSAHQPTFLKFYEYDSNLDGARTDDAYVGGDDY